MRVRQMPAQAISKTLSLLFLPSSFLKFASLVFAICVQSTAAHANIVVCSFDRVTASGMGNENTRKFFGEVLTFDTSAKAFKVQWAEGESGWMKTDQFSQNNSFSSYIIFEDINFPDGKMKVKLIFRLSNDEKSLETRAEPQKRLSGAWWRQIAARYNCE